MSALIQGYEAGKLPGKPDVLNASFSKSGTKGTLSVTTGTTSKTVSFSSTITYPSGNPPAAGWPLIIAYGGGSIPIPNTVSAFSQM